MIITASAIIFSITTAMANPTGTTLTFWDSFGQHLIQPIMPEIAEPIAFEVAMEVESIRTVYRFVKIAAQSRLRDLSRST